MGYSRHSLSSLSFIIIGLFTVPNGLLEQELLRRKVCGISYGSSYSSRTHFCSSLQVKIIRMLFLLLRQNGCSEQTLEPSCIHSTTRQLLAIITPLSFTNLVQVSCNIIGSRALYSVKVHGIQDLSSKLRLQNL